MGPATSVGDSVGGRLVQRPLADIGVPEQGLPRRDRCALPALWRWHSQFGAQTPSMPGGADGGVEPERLRHLPRVTP